MKRWRLVLIWLFPTLATLIWALVVAETVGFKRVSQHWEAAITMAFGSFLAGSSPEGGGSVAFPIFTKVLHTSAPFARLFTLSIQTAGMSMATIVIYLSQRALEPQVILIGITAGTTGFIAILFGFSDRTVAFWPSSIPPSWAKLTFSLCLAAMSFMMIFILREFAKTGRESTLNRIEWNVRVVVGCSLCAFVGGCISCLTGTGVNVLLFLFTVIMCDLSVKVAIPTTVVVMAFISIVGFVIICMGGQQIDVRLNTAGLVQSVGSFQLDPPELARNHDLLGMWLAAVPVVVWGAPLGTVAVHYLPEQVVVGCVAMLALTEVVSTFVLDQGLHHATPLLAYGLVGLVAGPIAIVVLRKYRHQILATKASEDLGMDNLEPDPGIQDSYKRLDDVASQQI